MSDPAGSGGNIHAGLVRLGAAGVLIRGSARSGKSSLAVSLLRAAAREGVDAWLVADDRVELERRGDRLFGRAPETIRGLIELSGIGILHVEPCERAEITHVVDLTEAPERLPEGDADELCGLRLPRLLLPARQAPFGADLVMTALAPGARFLAAR